MQPSHKSGAAAWGVVGAACAGLITYLTSAAGVALAGVLGAVQVGFLVGAVVGVVSRSMRTALAASAIGLVCGIVIFPPWFDRGEPVTLLVLLLVGAGVSAGVRTALDRQLVRPGLIAAIAVGLAIACTLLVASSIITIPNPNDGGMTVLQHLEKHPVPGETWSDSQFYQVVVWKMRDGMGYLEAFRSAYHENPSWRIDPFSVFAVRPPLMFYFWKSLPDPWTQSALWALIGIVCLAMTAAPAVASRSVAPIVGVAGATALSGYALGFALKPGLLFMFEVWSGVFAVLVLGAYALAMGERGSRGWMVAAAALALLAAVARELMVFLLLAGLIAAFFSRKERRRFDVLIWAAACAGFAVYWAIQAAADRSIVTVVKPMATVWLAHGGFSNLVSGLVISTWAVGGSWISVALVLLGIAGAAAQRNVQFRAFALAAVLMPLIGFMFVGTNAQTTATGQPYNYWGAIVMPLLYVLAPTAIAWIPSMRASSASMLVASQASPPDGAAGTTA